MFLPLIIFTLFPVFSLSQNIEQFANCTTKFYSCGRTVQLIGYPFWGSSRPSYCGLHDFWLTCRGDNVSTIQISNITFRVLQINQNDRRFTIAHEDLWETNGVCLLQQQESVNSALDTTLFAYILEDFLFLVIYYSCLINDNSQIPIRNRLNCSSNSDGRRRLSFFEDRSVSVGVEGCESEISVPVLRTAFDEFKGDEKVPMEGLLRYGFPVEYPTDGACNRCESSDGTCWSGVNFSGPSCLCPDGISRLVCSNSGTEITLT